MMRSQERGWHAPGRLSAGGTMFRKAAVHRPSGWEWLQRLGTRGAAERRDSAVGGCRTPKMARLEAALFVADGALSLRRLSQVATLADAREAQTLIDELNALYDAGGSPFRVERVATGVQLLTRPRLANWLDRVHQRRSHLKLSSSAMETLAIIAYRQPCTRADVEAIRGVQSAEIIKQLMERNLVRVAGEDDSLGRPYLYGTTRLFLETYGLTHLADLPLADLLRPSAPASDPAPAAVDDAESIRADAA